MDHALPAVLAVARDGGHRFGKPVREVIELVEGVGILGDAHAGPTVQHLSRKRRDPAAPNLRQVHLIHAELFREVAEHGFSVEPGELGENITTRGIDLLGLGAGTVLTFPSGASVEITGLRNPCVQIDRYQDGLMKELVGRGPDGEVVRKAGVMAIVRAGGVVRPGDTIAVASPPVHSPLLPV